MNKHRLFPIIALLLWGNLAHTATASASGDSGRNIAPQSSIVLSQTNPPQLKPDALPDDYLLFTLIRTDAKWEGSSQQLEGFKVSLDIPASWMRDGFDLNQLMSRIRQQKTVGILTDPRGGTTPIFYEVVNQRGKDEVYMKTTQGYFLWEYVEIRKNEIVFAIYWWYCPPAQEVDLKILEQAEQLLSDPAHWHQKDDRACEGDQKNNRWSLFCALKYASIQNAGEYNHHNTAVQTVRFVIDELVPGHEFAHTLMDYNNAPSTRHGDVLHCLALAKERIKTKIHNPARSSAPPTPQANAKISSFLAAEDEWRAERDRELRSPDSWLTIAGLFWLKEGENAFGTAPSNAIVLPPGSAPERAGIFNLDEGVISVEAAAGASLKVNGKSAEKTVLKDETQGVADVVGCGRLSLWIIKRDTRYAVRLRDPDHPAFKAFTKLDYFPASAEYRITGEFRPLSKPEAIRVEAKIVGTTEMTAVGRVLFAFRGEKYEVEAWRGEIEGTIHLVLGDSTNGRETYGGGRFLDAALLEGGKADLNFNRLYNPPCVFSSFATCPLPPRGNRLPFRVEAGEKMYYGAGH